MTPRSQELVIDGDRFSDYDGFVEEFNRTYLAAFGGAPWDGVSFIDFDDFLKAAGDRVTIRWINSQKSMSDLGHEEMARLWSRKLAHIPAWAFSPASNELLSRGYQEKIDQAAAGQGTTLYEWLVWQIRECVDDQGSEMIDLELE
jgi:hypothetical protein